MKQLVLVGVDPGAASGLAAMTADGQLVAADSVSIKRGRSVYADALSALMPALDGYALAAAAVESQWFMPAKAGQNPRTIISLAHTAGEWAGALAACGLDCAPWYVTPSEWRKLCGLPVKGRDLKARAVDKARSLGYDGEDHNAAEAVCICEALRVRCSL